MPSSELLSVYRKDKTVIMADERRDRYAPVYGNVAYDYASAAPEEIYEEPEIKPQAQPKPAPAPRRQTRYSVSVVSVMGLAFACFMLVIAILAYIRLADVAHTTALLEEHYAELSEENRRLKIAYEEAFDSNAIEEYAVNDLGMSKPSDAQVEYFNFSVGDRAEVLNAGETKNSGIKDIIAFAKSLFEYF